MRAKFEEWEDSQDAKDQLAQMAAYDENGERLETAGVLRKKFEALKMYEEEQNKTPPPIQKQFRPKRFKVRRLFGFDCDRQSESKQIFDPVSLVIRLVF